MPRPLASGHCGSPGGAVNLLALADILMRRSVWLIGGDGWAYDIVGADAVMMTSARLRHGPDHLGAMKAGLERWLGEQRVESLDQVRGLRNARRAEDAGAFFRAQYVSAQTEYVPRKLVQ